MNSGPHPTIQRHRCCSKYAGSDRSGRGHKPSQHLYLLWRWDTVKGKKERQWLELARISAEGLEWVDTLRRIAMGAMSGCGPKREAAAPAATARVLSALESELEILDTEDRRNLLGLLYEQFLGRMCRENVPEVFTR